MVEEGEVASLPGRATKIVEATALPVVFTCVADPLRSGLIASYASSQNNLTGIASYAGPLSGKRLEILQEVAPQIKRVLVFVAPQDSIAEVSFQFPAAVAPKLGVELLRHDVTSKEEIEQVLKTLPRGAVDAIYLVPAGLVATYIDLLIQKAKEDRIPLAVTDTSMVERGALISYGAEFRLLGLQASKLVAKVLKGAKPSEMPIQTPEKLVLTINLSTAKAIGLDIPRSILERAEHIVE